MVEEATGRVLTVLAKADGPVAAKEVDDVVGARSGEGRLGYRLGVAVVVVRAGE